MLDNSELNLLVSNVINENRYSHCRLCLKHIQDDYVRLNETITLYPTSEDFRTQTLSEALTKIIGPDVSDEIVGIDAVCVDCVERALETLRFLKTCEQSNTLLNNVFNNLYTSLNIDDEQQISSNRDRTLYISVGEEESQLFIVKNEVKTSQTEKFYCNICQKQFKDLDEVQDHNELCHSVITCKKCKDSLKTEEEVADHENSEFTYKCPECKVHKCTMESLKRHQDLAHGVFVCKDCGKSFKSMDRLQIHEQKHVTKSECPKCGKSYNTKGFFLKHVKLCLEDRIEPHPLRSKMEKRYFCNSCGKGYSTPGGLRVHNRFVHGNAKPHVCKYCNKEFTAPSYLKVHMVKHTGEKNFKCDICNRKFVSKEALLYHTRRHTGDKPYSCTMCDEKFVNASARAEHIKFKHVGPTLMCEICSRKFFTPSFLQQHLKKHHDPSNKLYMGRSLIPANVPAVENMRVKVIN